MTTMKMLPVPAWVTPEHRAMFTLRLAATYHNSDGSIRQLSRALEKSDSYLHMAASTSGLNAETCIALEELLGRACFPREFFRPDIFIPAA